ncbi:hypothetical protein PybrP1_005256 [[Pythium] brassicae (nom. inval.)]|nr:hypothetical protein PybrP1_005256 [[Pythium] brassicae (nom. inval.)]
MAPASRPSAADAGDAAAAASKRKWAEVDWEVVMEAQSFVAVYADPEPEAAHTDAVPAKAATSKAAAKKRGRKSKTSKAAAPAPAKRGRKSAKAAEPTRVSPRTTRARAGSASAKVDDEEVKEAKEAGAKATEAAAEADKPEDFWLAQLLDDVTEDMLEDDDASVRVTWLNRVAGPQQQQPATTTKNGGRYEFAFDDTVTVQSILCHVYLVERSSDALLELTPKSLARVERSVERAKTGDADADADDADLHERPPPSRARASGSGASGRKATASGGVNSGASSNSASGRKLSKRDDALLVPPRYATVDLAQYEDSELFGSQGLTDFKKDVFSANREVLRAVLTQNHALLKRLTTDKAVYKGLSTFAAARSADVNLSALQYAIERDDLTAAALLLKARDVNKALLARAPTVALPSHSTGRHTSAFSDYNRRALNASRGGKEGNKALVEDATNGGGGAARVQAEERQLWNSPSTSLQMLALHYPTGGWVYENHVVYSIMHAARLGNARLVAKVVETLAKNGGWGFNELHYRVLSDADDALPAFRGASAAKMAAQTRVRPLHLAAINPNAKYLEALWESAGSDAQDAKDANGFEVVHYAAVCEGTGPLAFLLERNASLAARSKARETPLMRALLARREANVALMLAHAAAEASGEAMRKLVAERGPLARQAVHYAAEQGCAAALTALLAHGADRNSPGTDKKTPLCFAAQGGHLACVQALLDAGAKVDGGDKLRKTPLIYAVKNGHTRVAALLLNHGANANAYDTSENSAVHYAASYGWPSSLQLLADAGADFWVRNSWGFVPLICALLKNRLSACEFILAHDAQQRFLDFRDRQGCTMLFLQCQHATDLAQIEYLLAKGLSPDICDAEREYPLQHLLARAARAKASPSAATAGVEDPAGFFEAAVRLLLARGARPHYEIERVTTETDDDDDDSNDSDDSASPHWQPLLLAMKGGLDAHFDMLLGEFGADPAATAANGADAWTVAASLGRRGDRYLEALLQHHATTRAGEALALGARAGDKGKDNFFHVVARSSAKASVSPALVRQCIERCASPATLMNEKDSKGRSPLLVLLSQERKVVPRPSSSAELSDLVEACKTRDAAYSELVALFAEFTTSADAFVRFVTKNKLAGAVEAKSQVVEDSVENVPYNGSDNGSDDNDDDDDDDDDDDNDDDNDDDDNDDDDSDDDDPDADAASKPPTARRKSNNDSPDAKLLVQFETALQLAAHRKLVLGATDAMRQWFGDNLVRVLFDKSGRLLDAALINFQDLTNNKTALQYAVEAGDVESVRLLVVNGANPNLSPFRCDVCQRKLLAPTDDACASKCGSELVETALYTAVQQGSLAITELLLSHGADVACFERTTLNTPLHRALGANHAAITKALLAHGANLSQRNASGAAPLHFAVLAKHSIPESEPHQDEVAYTDDGSQAAATGRTGSAAGKQSAIQVALQDPHAVHAVLLPDSASLTPIHLAAANRDLALLRDLVAASADAAAATNVRTALGRAPLHYAVNSATMTPDASFELERFLLQRGADVNAVDAFGCAALHFALLKVDMNWHAAYDARHRDAPDAPLDDSDANDAAAYEAKRAQAFLDALAAIPRSESDPVETVSNLAAVRGVDLMLQDALGRSALHLAAATGAFVCVSMLVAACATEAARLRLLALTDKEAFTALGQGVLHLRQTTIMTLLQNKADVQGTVCIKTPAPSPGPNGEDAPVKVRRYSYFYHAVKHSLTGICHMLLTAKFSHRQAIEDAVRCGQFQLAYNLVVGTEVANDAALLPRLNAEGESLLHTLAKVAKPFDKLARTLAWTLLDAGVDPRQRNAAGNAALHYAAKRGNTHLMDFLLHHAAGDVNAANAAGETPLLYALKRGKALSRAGSIRVATYLMARPGFLLHAKDAAGMNVLTAYLDRFTDVVDSEQDHFVWLESLLQQGVDPNARFTSLARADLFRNPVLGASSVGVAMPALVRVALAPAPFARFHSLALLLRYGATVAAADALGNGVVTHLVAKNLVRETRLALGNVARVADPTRDRAEKAFVAVHVAAADVRAALALANRAGQTALHFAVKPFAFESFENAALVRLLLAAGASLHAPDRAGRSPLDYTRGQASRFLFRFLKREFPALVAASEDAFFSRAETTEDAPMFSRAPDFVADARAYLLACEQDGRIRRTRVEPEVNPNCDVGKQRRVFAPLDAAGAPVPGEAFSALLTKVDVRNGRFGLNVFYRLQLVTDEIQGLFVVFTNWGRIGETGKFQNTPFRAAEDAVAEFKKIFRAKTGTHWGDRAAFAAQRGKYNLVQRVDTRTSVDAAVTASFSELAPDAAAALPAFADAASFPPSVVRLLGAITDIRNLELAATEGCNFSDSLPLAKEDELRAAVAKLEAIRALLERRDEVSKEIAQASGDVASAADATATLAAHADAHSALTESISELSSRYYEIMPCNEDAFGASIKAFDSVTSVNAELTRLRLLLDIMASYQVILGAKLRQRDVHPLEYCYNAMQVQLAPLAPGDAEATLLTKYFFNGLRPLDKARYKVASAFRVRRQGEQARFAAFQAAHPAFQRSHAQLLWHGTRRTNLMGILSQGLRIAPPEAPHHGYLYGKGLYFADVTAKSVDYCGAPYKLKTATAGVDASGKPIARERSVFYMLLCEVATGTPTEVTGSVSWALKRDLPSADSVHALSRFVPDPTGAVVSPESGAKLHLGAVDQVGARVPLSHVWAKTELSRVPGAWYKLQSIFSKETQQVLATAVETLGVGESLTVDDENRQHFVYEAWNASERKVTIEVLSKDAGGDDNGDDEGDIGTYCDATVKVVFCNPNEEQYHYVAKRYRNYLRGFPLERGFTAQIPDFADYSEFIVYNEAQARIRYLLEIEHALGKLEKEDTT